LAKTILRGRYLIVDEAFLREKANRADPRNIFYRAMLERRTYEGYEDAVRGIAVTVPTYRMGPVNGRMEILYARRKGWIEDERGRSRGGVN
jgi:hypothetical protein